MVWLIRMRHGTRVMVWGVAASPSCHTMPCPKALSSSQLAMPSLMCAHLDLELAVDSLRFKPRTSALSWAEVVRLEICLSRCVPSAIPVEERRNVSSNVTTSRAVGVWNIYGGKFQTDTPTEVFRILAEEILGYNVFVEAKNTGSIIDALYGLAGCEEPENASYRNCQGQSTRHHVSIGLHLASNQTLGHWRSIQRFKRGGMLESLGTAGFTSQAGLQISRATLLKGQQAAEPLFLDDFRSYNSLFFSPQVFFEKFTEIDEQLLIPCSTWRLDAAEGLVSYVSQTGDTDGVVGTGESMTLRCLGRWWLAPSCRASRRCVPCITGANDYNQAFHAVEIMEKARFRKLRAENRNI